MFVQLSAFGTIFLILSGCSPMIDVHGDSVDPEVVASLKPGETVYTEVQQKLGSPSSKTVFDGEDWIYLHSKQERFAFLKPKEIHREITVLKFDRNGVLQNIETKTLKNGRLIVPASAGSKTDPDSLTIMDQIISNVGRMGTDSPAY